MTTREILRIEAEARRMRAEVLTGMFRSFYRAIARTPIVAARTSRTA